MIPLTVLIWLPTLFRDYVSNSTKNQHIECDLLLHAPVKFDSSSMISVIVISLSYIYIIYYIIFQLLCSYCSNFHGSYDIDY